MHITTNGISGQVTWETDRASEVCRRPAREWGSSGKHLSHLAMLGSCDPVQLLYPCGLTNLGNTCYMNATIQCLKCVPELKEAIQKYEVVFNVVWCLYLHCRCHSYQPDASVHIPGSPTAIVAGECELSVDHVELAKIIIRSCSLCG